MINIKKKEIQSFKIVYDDSIVYNKKSITRDSINNLYNIKDDCDEIIIIKNNLITDTSIANIAIFLDNCWITPKKPLLVGTTMSRLIDNKKLKMVDISVNMLRKATKIATLNAMVGFNKIDNFIIKG